MQNYRIYSKSRNNADTFKTTDEASSSSSPSSSSLRRHQHHENKNGTFEELIIVSAFTSNQLPQVGPFLKNIHDFLPSSTVVLWNLDTASSSEPESDEEEPEVLQNLKHLCNSSSSNNNNKCCIEKFNFNDYPAHVKYLELKAYRPIIIQTHLKKDGGCVMWLDIDRRLLPDVNKEVVNNFLHMALSGASKGIIGWPTERVTPTSSLTHPKTFSFFQTDVENFFFLRMIDPSNLLVCDTEYIHSKIMLRWIECTLTKDCIYPTGAQSTGCRYDKKPLFRYSGCHAYSDSALNVALGQNFGLTSQPYISRKLISQKKSNSCPNNCINVNQTYT